MSEAMAEAMKPIPSFEVDRRILEAKENIKEVLGVKMEEFDKKLENVTIEMRQLIGTTEMPGVLARIEANLGRVAKKQEDKIASDQARAREDDVFRSSVLNDITLVKNRLIVVEQKIAVFAAVITISRMVVSAFSTDIEVLPDGTSVKKRKGVFRLLAGIFGGIIWISVVQFWHTVWPMIRESFIHHKLMH